MALYQPYNFELVNRVELAAQSLLLVCLVVASTYLATGRNDHLLDSGTAAAKRRGAGTFVLIALCATIVMFIIALVAVHQGPVADWRSSLTACGRRSHARRGTGSPTGDGSP